MIVRVFLDRLVTLHGEQYYNTHTYCNLRRLYSTRNKCTICSSVYFVVPASCEYGLYNTRFEWHYLVHICVIVSVLYVIVPVLYIYAIISALYVIVPVLYIYATISVLYVIVPVLYIYVIIPLLFVIFPVF